MLHIYDRITHTTTTVDSRVEVCAIVGTSLKHLNKQFGIYKFYKTPYFIVTDTRFKGEAGFTREEIEELYPDKYPLIFCRPVAGGEPQAFGGREPLAAFLRVPKGISRMKYCPIPSIINDHICWNPTITKFDDLDISKLPTLTLETVW